MKTSILKFLSILNLFVIISCHKDEVVQQHTMSFTTNNTYESSWVILSDESGKVLEWKSLLPNVASVFTYSVKGDSVNVTVIRKSTLNNTITYSLDTYTNVATGDYTFDAGISTPARSINGVYTLMIPSPTDFYDIYLGADCGYNANQDYTQYNINVCDGTSLFLSLQKDQYSIPKYLYIPQISPSGVTVLDQTLFNSLPEMKSKALTFNDEVFAYSFVFGNTAIPNQSFLVSDYQTSQAATLYPIYYADKVGSFFKDYKINLYYQKANNISVRYETGKQISDPANFSVEELPANLVNVSSATPSLISYQLDGKAHFSFLTLSTYKPNSTAPLLPYAGTWNITSNFANKIEVNLPQFPDDLKKIVDFSFLTDLSLQSIGLCESSDDGGYHSYYKRSIMGNAILNNYRSVINDVKPDGTIGSRFANFSLSQHRSLLHK